MKKVAIIDGVRTAIGNYGGSLKDIPVTQLGSHIIKETLKRASLRPKKSAELLEYIPDVLRVGDFTDLEHCYADWDDSLQAVEIDEVIMGNVLQAGQGQNVARQSAIYAGIYKETPAYTVNMVCASGMKSIALAMQAISSGHANVIIAGGMENMSSVPYYIPKARWGVRMFNAEIVDGMIRDGLWEIFFNYHMGITAENIAEKYGISRKEQDEFALLSNQRALSAIKDDIFEREIVPVEVQRNKGTESFYVDEHPRESSLEDMTKLNPVFKQSGNVTAGNSSGITDGSGALLIMSEEKARKAGIEAMAVIRSFACTGIDPAYMGLGPIPATKKALRIAGLSIKDIDIIELNEAFAAQAIAVIRELDIDIEKTNPHGGAISLGHPIGCTGTRIIVTLIHEMVRKGLQFGLATLCVGGGQGMAMVIEHA